MIEPTHVQCAFTVATQLLAHHAARQAAQVAQNELGEGAAAIATLDTALTPLAALHKLIYKAVCERTRKISPQAAEDAVNNTLNALPEHEKERLCEAIAYEIHYGCPHSRSLHSEREDGPDTYRVGTGPLEAVTLD